MEGALLFMGYGWGMRVVEIPCAFHFEKMQHLNCRTFRDWQQFFATTL
jgi:hypothetical protein